MNEKEVKNELKKIKVAYLRAIEKQALSEEDKEIALNNFKFAIKQAPSIFYAVWIGDPGRLPAERPRNGWDSLHGFLNGVSRFFSYLGVGSLSAAGVLTILALLLSPAGPAVIITLIALSIIGGVGGASSLGLGLIFKLFSLIPELIINHFDRKHHEQIFQAVNQVTDIVINTITMNTTYVNVSNNINVVPSQNNIQWVNPKPTEEVILKPIYESTNNTNYQPIVDHDENQKSFYKLGYGSNFSDS